MRTYTIHNAQELHETVIDLLNRNLIIYQYYATIDFCKRVVGFYWENLPLGRKRVFEGSIWHGNRVKIILKKE